MSQANPRHVTAARAFSGYLIILGATHFVAPRQWDTMTRLVVADDVRRWTYRFGLFETTMGVLFMQPSTRLLACAGLLAQAGYLVQLRRAVADRR